MGSLVGVASSISLHKISYRTFQGSRTGASKGLIFQAIYLFLPP